MIDVCDLRRTFKTKSGMVEAVRGVTFSVGAKEIVGFLGPNGAGKSTTQRMLATLLTPTSGSATVAGCDLLRDPVGVRRNIGYVPQGGSTNPMATVNEELLTQAALHRISADVAKRRIAELCASLDLADLGSRQTQTLSGGQRRRLDIALGLLHQPKLVFLDEPSTGLDPHSRANLWQHIRALRDVSGASIVLTTHYLDEADTLCDRILVIDHGKIVGEGTPQELKQRISGDLVTFDVGSNQQQIVAAQKALQGHAAIRELTILNDKLRAVVNQGSTDALILMRILDAAALTVIAMTVTQPTLDDVFLTLTGRSLRDENQNDNPESRHVA
jgi:ABC-2 type transport system ATP-binding protein